MVIRKALNNYKIICTLILALSLVLINLPSINPVGESSWCCEKTVKGAWCMDVKDKTECATGAGLNVPVPTSCQATSYCKLGWCYDTAEFTTDSN